MDYKKKKIEIEVPDVENMTEAEKISCVTFLMGEIVMLVDKKPETEVEMQEYGNILYSFAEVTKKDGGNK